MSYAILVVLSIVLLATPANAKKRKRPVPGPTLIYIINKSSDVPAQAWGGHWNQDVFNACVDVLRVHTDLVAQFYHPQGVNLVVADPSSNPKGWKAIFRSGGTGGYHTASKGYSIAIAYTGSLLRVRSPCTVMGEELVEMLGNPRPGSVCFNTPSGQRIQPEIVDPIWGGAYCPEGYEPECADTVAGPVPGFVLPAWFANKYGVRGLSNELTYPAGVVSKPWQKTSGGAYFPCN
ncbi:MAG: hypothetical protein Q7S58_00455 [Candidatus Binatus sp.]|uniref:hypothetical protein n=1 Tax=Candidatus Binatus sp. TaxID=2811406 RepID=UPI002722413B|nr:hypothetical protein [Candidatus Binatus sp.]MDO8430857.1 hypothetical protein [Candidatus Binatus sp.]